MARCDQGHSISMGGEETRCPRAVTTTAIPVSMRSPVAVLTATTRLPSSLVSMAAAGCLQPDGYALRPRGGSRRHRRCPMRRRGRNRVRRHGRRVSNLKPGASSAVSAALMMSVVTPTDCLCRDVGPEGRQIVRSREHQVAGAGVAALAADHVREVAEDVQAPPRQFGVDGGGVVHPNRAAAAPGGAAAQGFPLEEHDAAQAMVGGGEREVAATLQPMTPPPMMTTSAVSVAPVITQMLPRGRVPEGGRWQWTRRPRGRVTVSSGRSFS